MVRARCCAASSLYIFSISSSDYSLKLGFLSQTAAVVLSPITRRYEDGGIRISRMSSHIQTMLDRNSRKFMWARARRCVGNPHRHAVPMALYPPRP